MAKSDIEICNSALAKLGAGRISSLTEETNLARLVSHQYPLCKKALLGSHPWNFAIKQDTLVAASVAPLMEFSKRYPLPKDCIRVLEADTAGYPWKVEGRYLLSDSGNTIVIRYVCDSVSEGDFSPMFDEALAYALASDICFSVTQSTTLTEVLDKKYKKALSEARTFDAQESTGDRVYADFWLNSRL